MNWPEECAVVIPCLNEAAEIARVIEGARRQIPQVIVVDDGSSDQTRALAEGVGAEVIRHEVTRGKGAALSAGWRRAREREFSWVLMMDGDGQHSPDDIPLLVAEAERSGAELVVGDRMAEAAQMPWLRRAVNRWMSKRLSRATGQCLPDTQCGFRLMNLGAWQTLSITATHFEIESDLLTAFIAAGHRVSFVPVQVIYKREHSKIHPVRDSWRWFRWWSRAKRNFPARNPLADAPPAKAGTPNLEIETHGVPPSGGGRARG
jgi:glycosyltransferase involved in cell wall biosynthesis